MDQPFFTFKIDGLSSNLDAVRFSGTEGMSELFEFEIDLVSDDPAIEFDDVIGKPALLSMESSDGPRHIHGMVSCFEETGVGRNFTRYAATLVPAHWALTLRQDCCIYQDLSTPDIIKQVMTDAGMTAGRDFSIDTKGTYGKREYCVQYRESDFEFISRLMEEEGLFYFFAHAEDGHKMMIRDDVSAYADIEGNAVLKFHAAETGLQADEEEVRHLRYARSLRVGKVVMQDYNFQKTAHDLKNEKEGEAEAHLEHYDYPGRYIEGAHGKTRSTVRLEAMSRDRRTLSGESNCRRFTPGHKFAVSEHPRDAFNADFLLIRIEHHGSQPQAATLDAVVAEEGQTYRNEFEALPAEVLFRAPQVTPGGLVEGPQTAVVTGPAGEEIFVDAHGRVKVQFHWDRLGKKDDKSSCWVRVSQGWAGATYGSMIIPRVGHEVVVSFLEGDPDQPLITGRVFNGTNTHSYDLPGDKTKTSMRSNSSPGGGGYNEIRFEDAAGSEEVLVHAHKDWKIEVGHNRDQSVVNDATSTIGHDETIEVKRDRALTVDRDELIKITGDQTISVGGNLSEKIEKNETDEIGGNLTLTVGKDESDTVKGGRTTSIGKDESITVGGSHSETVEKDQTIEVGKDRSDTIKKNLNLSIGKGATIDVGKDWALTVTGSSTETIKKKKTLEVTDEFSIVCGDAKITLKKDGSIKIEGSKIEMKSSGPIKMKGSAIDEN